MGDSQAVLLSQTGKLTLGGAGLGANAIYNRALSAAEIQALYNATK